MIRTFLPAFAWQSRAIFARHVRVHLRKWHTALLPPVFVLGGEWLGVRTAGFMFLYAALVACMLVMLADHARGASRT